MGKKKNPQGKERKELLLFPFRFAFARCVLHVMSWWIFPKHTALPKTRSEWFYRETMHIWPFLAGALLSGGTFILLGIRGTKDPEKRAKSDYWRQIEAPGTYSGKGKSHDHGHQAPSQTGAHDAAGHSAGAHASAPAAGAAAAAADSPQLQALRLVLPSPVVDHIAKEGKLSVASSSHSAKH